MGAIRALTDFLMRMSVYVFAALLPVFFIPGGYVAIPQAKLLLIAGFVAFAGACWFINCLATGSARLPRHMVFFTALLLPIAYLLSSLSAGLTTASLVGGLAEQDTVVTVALWFFGLFLAAVILGRDTQTLIAFVRALVVGLAALLIFQVARLFFADALLFNGTFPNQTITAAGSWHDLGIMFAFAALFCGALLRTRFAASGFWRSLFAIVATGSFLFLIVISMQDVWYICAAACALFGIYVWFSGGNEEGMTPRGRAVRAGIWILVAVVAAVGGWFTTTIHDNLPEKLQVVSVEVRPSWEGTLQVSGESLQDSRTLFFGSGPNSFARNWALYKPTAVNTTLFWNFDFNAGVGVVPTSFITIGAFGVGAWILLMLGFLFSASRALIATRRFGATQTTVFSFACAIALVLAFHVLYVPGMAVSALLFVLLGAFMALPISDTRPVFTLSFGLNSIGRFLSAVFVLGIVIAMLSVTIVGARATLSDIYLNKSISTYANTQDAAQARMYIEQSLSTWPFNDRAHRAAVELGILKLAELSQQTDGAVVEQLQSTLTTTIEHGLSAVAIDGADYQNWLTLARLYQELAGVGVEGAYEQAQQAYTSARTENPTNPLPLLRLAQLEMVRGNRVIAIGYLDEAIALKQDYAIGYFLRSQLLAEEGRLDEAVESASIAAQLVPDDPLGWYNLGTILYLQESWEAAASVLYQVVTLRNDHANATFLLALSLHNLGEVEQALIALERVRELSPQDQIVPVIIENVREGRNPFEGVAP